MNLKLCNEKKIYLGNRQNFGIEINAADPRPFVYTNFLD